MNEDGHGHFPEGPLSTAQLDGSASCPQPTDYSKALARVRACVQHRAERLREEARQAAGRVRELLRQPQTRRRWMVRNSQRYRNWFVCDQLLEDCSKAWRTSPKSALELAGLALQVANGLDPEVHGGGPVEDLKAMAMAYSANCLRLLGRPNAAARCLRMARESYARGSGDQLLEARILTLKALLRVDEGRTGDALRLLEQAQELYFQTGDDGGIGNVLAIRGSLLLRAGDPFGSSWALRRAARRLEPDRDPELYLKVRQKLVQCALALGDLHQADRLLEATRDRLGKIPSHLMDRLSRWFRSALEGGAGAEEVAVLLVAEPAENAAFWR